MDWNYFAQINGDGICEAITQATGTITAPNIVPVTANTKPLGKRWNGTAWVEMPKPQPNPQ